MKNTFGSALSLTIFGESHGPAIGAVLDGMAAGVPVDEGFIAQCMDARRARGDGLSTPRTEADQVHILSGVYQGRTTGSSIALVIQNQNTRSGDYARTADLLRPGHADYTAYAKYHGWQDSRGGGHFSGRITAGLVAGGAIVLPALEAAASGSAPTWPSVPVCRTPPLPRMIPMPWLHNARLCAASRGWRCWTRRPVSG